MSLAISGNLESVCNNINYNVVDLGISVLMPENLKLFIDGEKL